MSFGIRRLYHERPYPRIGSAGIDELFLWSRVMNNRIRELYQRARGINQMSPDFMEAWEYKFAELIVQDCITQITELKDCDIGAKNEYTRGLDAGMSMAIRTIKEHFGTEK